MKSVKFIQEHWAVLLPASALLGLTILVVRAIRVTRGNVSTAFSLISGENFFAAVMFLALQSLPWLAIGAVFALILEIVRPRNPVSRRLGSLGVLVLLVALVAASAPLWALIVLAATAGFVVLNLLYIRAIDLVLVRFDAPIQRWSRRLSKGKAYRRFRLFVLRRLRHSKMRRPAATTEAELAGESRQSSRLVRYVRGFERIATIVPAVLAFAFPIGIAALGTELWVPTENVQLRSLVNLPGVYVIDDSNDWVMILQSNGSQPALIRDGDLISRTFCTRGSTTNITLAAPLGVDSPIPLPTCAKQMFAAAHSSP